MQEPSIRRAGSDDAEALAVIGRATFVETFGHLYPADDLSTFLEEAYDAQRTQADLADPRNAAWLVEADGRAVGYAQAGPCALPHPEVTPRCLELKRFYLLRAWQGGGLGSRLYAAVADWFERQAPHHLWLGVWEANHGAQRFYTRQGFTPVGRYSFRVGKTLDPEIIMRRSCG